VTTRRWPETTRLPFRKGGPNAKEGPQTVTRAQQKTSQRLRLAPAALGLGLAALLTVSGCSAGQVTQTDSMLPAVNGAFGGIGPIAIRDAKLAYPHGGSYQPGADAPLVLTMVNTGPTDDELLEVSSPVATDVELRGDQSLPARRSLAVGTPGMEVPESSSSVRPTTTTPVTPSPTARTTTSSAAPVEIGTLSIVLKGLNTELMSGKTVQVTFVFRTGSSTIELPIASPTSARPEPTEAH
jgi:copper(I)-binding protein